MHSRGCVMETLGGDGMRLSWTAGSGLAVERRHLLDPVSLQPNTAVEVLIPETAADPERLYWRDSSTPASSSRCAPGVISRVERRPPCASPARRSRRRSSRNGASGSSFQSQHLLGLAIVRGKTWAFLLKTLHSLS